MVHDMRACMEVFDEILWKKLSNTEDIDDIYGNACGWTLAGVHLAMDGYARLEGGWGSKMEEVGLKNTAGWKSTLEWMVGLGTYPMDVSWRVGSVFIPKENSIGLKSEEKMR